jgi:hypothetical protein
MGCCYAFEVFRHLCSVLNISVIEAFNIMIVDDIGLFVTSVAVHKHKVSCIAGLHICDFYG